MMNPMTHKQRKIMSIGMLAERFGVSPQSLRIWDRQGLIPPARRTPGGHRRYGPEHLHALDQILGAPSVVIPAKPIRPRSKARMRGPCPPLSTLLSQCGQSATRVRSKL
ncbi:MAG: MerR family DNA-binding transcriptional regulator [Phycisphaeraceae bacterium]